MLDKRFHLCISASTLDFGMKLSHQYRAFRGNKKFHCIEGGGGHGFAGTILKGTELRGHGIGSTVLKGGGDTVLRGHGI